MDKKQNKNTAILFNKGDKEYFEWIKNNQNGFILNTKKENKTVAFILHKSNCAHIAKNNNYDSKAYTMRDWIKVAANNVNEIAGFCYKNKSEFKGNFKLCKSCKPKYENTEIIYPDDIEDEENEFIEGAKKEITVNSYERDPRARKKCIEYYGCKCQCCGLDFYEKYGIIGKGFIHVHHLKLISKIGENYKIDPIKDLIPLCPNCHAMIHKQNPPSSVDELKEKIKE